jgi:hypothetical protein
MAEYCILHVLLLLGTFRSTSKCVKGMKIHERNNSPFSFDERFPLVC